MLTTWRPWFRVEHPTAHCPASFATEGKESTMIDILSSPSSLGVVAAAGCHPSIFSVDLFSKPLCSAYTSAHFMVSHTLALLTTIDFKQSNSTNIKAKPRDAVPILILFLLSGRRCSVPPQPASQQRTARTSAQGPPWVVRK